MNIQRVFEIHVCYFIRFTRLITTTDIWHQNFKIIRNLKNEEQSSNLEWSFRATKPIYSMSMQKNGPRSLKIEIYISIKKNVHIEIKLYS